MTTVTGTVTRECLGLDSFADLVPNVACTAVLATGVEFAGNLTPAQVDAVRARMTSRDDDDQMARANLADLLTTDTTASPLAQAVAAYLLGDS